MFVTGFGWLLLAVSVVVVFVWFHYSKTVVRKRILIIVLGDVGRSPRMQYHALSFAKEGFAVDLVGFDHSPLVKELQDQSSVRIVSLNELPKKPTWLPRLLYYIFKTIYLFLQLVLVILWRTSRHSHVLVQNPPAIPTLAVAWLMSLARQSKFIIDWHNYGYTILSLALGSAHPLVKFSKFYEGILGRRAAHNICVTQAMRDDLSRRWGVRATTLYDRPPERFQNVDQDARHKIFMKLSESYDAFKPNTKDTTGTRFTSLDNSRATLRADRAALLISGTSWTEDEDFSILLDALKQYDKMADIESSKLPELVCVITGKGPLKAHYQEVILQTTLNRVQICTPWLHAEDYPVLVGSADLGICLHTSSSGLDLPMKVVDMFGCGVPVCAVNFPCLNELVIHGKNGLVFNGPEQLVGQLQELLVDFPKNQGMLDKFRENLKEFQKKRWHSCWKEAFYDPIFG